MNAAPDHPLTLALDTATTQLSLGLLGAAGRSGLLALARTPQVGRAHAERLPAELGALFMEAELGLAPGVDGRAPAELIVVGTGPGSYTGLRVGASYALGLGRAWGVPVRGVSTLEGLTAGAPDGLLAVSLDARKGQLYGAVYRLSGGLVAEALHPPRKQARDDFAAAVAGVCWREDTPDAPLFPDPLALARNGLAHGQGDWALSYL